MVHLVSKHQNTRPAVLFALAALSPFLSSCASSNQSYQTAARPVPTFFSTSYHMTAPERAQVWGFVQTGKISRKGPVPDLSDQGIRQAIADATPAELRI